MVALDVNVAKSYVLENNMLCYKDKTYCGNSKKCSDTKCESYLSQDVIDRAIKHNLNISQCNFNCIKPIKKNKNV